MMPILSDIGMLLFPRFCKVCGNKLNQSEEHICTSCLRRLPKTNYDPMALNPVMQHFVGIPAIQHATAWFFYSHGNAYSKLITLSKYNDKPEIGRYLGLLAAKELAGTGFFEGIDCLLPVPLSRQRKWKRGYNQSEWIARGISKTTGLPVSQGVLIRHKHNKTQTHFHFDDRWENVQGIFSVTNPKHLAGRHILLIDDVITTGATLMACADTLSHVLPDIRISVFALACARDE